MRWTRVAAVLCAVAVVAGSTTTPSLGVAPPEAAGATARAEQHGDTLRVGQKLRPEERDSGGSRLTSANSEFFFQLSVYTPRGNKWFAVLDVGQTPREVQERATWRYRKRATYDAFAVLRPNGNFVLYSEPGVPIWSTRTAGTGRNNRLVIRDDGNLVMYGKGDRMVWSTGTGRMLLETGDTLRPGQRMVNAWEDGDSPTTLIMRRDGNLVVKYLGGIEWASNTSKPGAFLRLEPGGSLVIMRGAERLWLADPTRPGDDETLPYLSVENVGHFVVGDDYDSDDLWDSQDAPGETFLVQPGDLRVLVTGSVLTPERGLGSPQGHRLAMQPNGNLVLLRSDGVRVWASGTGGHRGARLEIRRSGNLVVTHRDRILWTSGPSRCNAYTRPVSVTVSRTAVLTARDGYGDVCWTSRQP